MITRNPRPSQPEDWPTGVASPARRALAAAGVTQLEQLTRISEAELLALHGMGPKAVRLLKVALAERGLALASPADTRPVSQSANRKIARRAPKSGRHS